MKRYLPLLFVTIFGLLYLLPRLINLSKNLQFRYDQGFQLLEVKEMVDSHQIRLIGPAVTSKTLSNGRQFFIGVTYYYFLAVMGIVFNWSPLLITAAIIVIEFAFYAIFLNFIRRRFGYIYAIFIGIIISFSPYLIFHSLFFWNPHFLIPLSILFIIFRKNSYLSAFIWGLAFSFHYSAVFWFVPYLFFRYLYHQFKIKTIFFSIIFFLFANLPFILFEFRHQFYNLKTLLMFYGKSSVSSGLSSHYFIFSLIVLLIYLFIFLSRKYHFPIYLFLLIFIFYKDNSEIDQLKNYDYPIQQEISRNISQSCPTKFNIAATNQGDTRAYDLRYLLALNHCIPLSVSEYPQANTVFLIAPPTRPPESETVWEISSFKPFKITEKITINNNVIFYRLDK